MNLNKTKLENCHGNTTARKNKWTKLTLPLSQVWLAQKLLEWGSGLHNQILNILQLMADLSPWASTCKLYKEHNLHKRVYLVTHVTPPLKHAL